MFSTHSCWIGLARGPDSPPTITQCIPFRFNCPKSSSNGSRDRNRTAAVMFLIVSILCMYFLFSTLVPSHMLGGMSVDAWFCMKSAMRWGLLVST